MGRHTLGVLDAETDEVPGELFPGVRGVCRVKICHDLVLTLCFPGTVLLLGGTSQEPLGLDQLKRKRTADGIILDPQPDDSPNDPLNWAVWRRNAALLCLGWHCLVGGGQTPILAAGFPDVAKTYGVSIPDVALTTGMRALFIIRAMTTMRSEH